MLSKPGFVSSVASPLKTHFANVDRTFITVRDKLFHGTFLFSALTTSTIVVTLPYISSINLELFAFAHYRCGASPFLANLESADVTAQMYQYCTCIAANMLHKILQTVQLFLAATTAATHSWDFLNPCKKPYPNLEGS
jgi:hypothetical protein